jgi:hypothetical protein
MKLIKITILKTKKIKRHSFKEDTNDVLFCQSCYYMTDCPAGWRKNTFQQFAQTYFSVSQKILQHIHENIIGVMLN